ncbi:hypothetical protein BofuT4_uP094240.1 [Botrytis cinerea T4]|uniref:Uncharacterized protein n=1 Tax=Botryotinia fuckeliana (strain T4) TaxID=999810 RepID=G2YD68_BOTF4|nr:hypothetical protein BofuT4_uP094240.1 [Botrytis cinerea T4]
MKIKQIGITFPNLTHAYGKQPTNHNKTTPKILHLTNKSENTPEHQIRLTSSKYGMKRPTMTEFPAPANSNAKEYLKMASTDKTSSNSNLGA